MREGLLPLGAFGHSRQLASFLVSQGQQRFSPGEKKEEVK